MRPITPGLFRMIECLHCKTLLRSYESNPRKFCSRNCLGAHARGDQRCQHCSGPIARPLSHGRKFCSNACRALGMRLERGQATRNEVVGRYIRHAKDRGLEWALSDEQVDALFAGACNWCGEPPSNIGKRSRNHGDFRHSGIDRVDNTRGYVPGNVVSCCFVCNSMKREFPMGLFLDRVRRIARRWP